MDDKTKELEDKLNAAMDDNAVVTTPEVTITPDKIKVGDAEYTQDELSRYVNLGRLGAEMEEKWNTKIDAVYPNYTRSREEVKTLQDQLAEAKASIPEPTLAPDAEQSKEALRILKEQFGVVTKDDLKQFVDQQYEEKSASEKLFNAVTGYSEEVDGADGRPVFKPEEVLLHMQETGIKDPMRAYKDKFENELDAWKAEKLVKGEVKEPIVTVTKATAGSKQPNEVRPTKDNLQQLLNDALIDR